MPWRPHRRDQVWLLPPSLNELLPADHPARFVAAFIDGLGGEAWADLGVDLAGEEVGAPAYHPGALLSVWLYGFMTGVRSSRKLEAACRDQISYLWLTGWQRPDHNTLWRFYQAHRQAMRTLLKRTVATAVHLGLVDLAVQALDGTKVAASAAGDRTYDAAKLRQLLERTEKAIAQLEAQNEGGDDPAPPRLPEALQRAEVLRDQVLAAMPRFDEDERLKRVNLTDSDAQLMKGRQGIMPAYNAQAMVSPLDSDHAGAPGMLITAADVTTSAADSGQLVPLLQQAEEMTETRCPVTLADGGYNTAANLEAGQRRAQELVMPHRYHEGVKAPTSRIGSSTTRPPIVISAPRASGCASEVSAEPTAGFRGRFARTPPRVRCAEPVRRTGSAQKMSVLDGYSGSVPPTPCCATIGAG